MSYVGALLQQLYHIPNFADCLYTVAVPRNCLLYHLQNLFAHLQESEKMDFDISDFAQAYRCASDQGLLINQDIFKFAVTLCNLVEEQLQGTPAYSTFGHFFSGKVAKMTYSELEKPKSQEIDFKAISLNAVSTNSLKDALDSYIKAVEVDPLQTSTPLPVKVRVLLSRLPPVLLFYLNRVDEHMRIKHNSFFSFPEHFNLKEWTKEGIFGYATNPPSYYEYSLVGVVLHSGNVELGHHFSIIKDRKTGKWFEFYDENVRAYDIVCSSFV